VNNKKIPTYVLIDCGATGFAFLNQNIAHNPQTPLQEMKETGQVKVINGRPIMSEDIIHFAKVAMVIQNHKEQLPLFVT